MGGTPTRRGRDGDATAPACPPAPRHLRTGGVRVGTESTGLVFGVIIASVRTLVKSADEYRLTGVVGGERQIARSYLSGFDKI